MIRHARNLWGKIPGRELREGGTAVRLWLSLTLSEGEWGKEGIWGKHGRLQCESKESLLRLSKILKLRSAFRKELHFLGMGSRAVREQPTGAQLPMQHCNRFREQQPRPLSSCIPCHQKSERHVLLVTVTLKLDLRSRCKMWVTCVSHWILKKFLKTFIFFFFF